jgi:hypothetical protein
MTAVTLHAILSQVPIVLVVTASALLRHLHGAGSFAMACGADQLAVRAEQRKMSILGVIEDP